MTEVSANPNPEWAVAVVGTGFIGPVHVEGLKRAGIPVTGILGSSLEKSSSAAAKLGLPRGYQSLDEILQDPRVKAVHIASPNRFHFEQAMSVLNAGKHVLCEKPLAMNSDQTRELVQLAETKKKVAGVAYNIRFYPLCHHAADIVRNEQLGEVLHVQGSYTQDWLLKKTDFNWRVSSKDGGELRAIADIGTHWLDLVQFIIGQRVCSVFSDLRTVYVERERVLGNTETYSGDSANEKLPTETVPIDTEDCGSVLLRFENGANGCLWVSQMTAGRKNCLRFELGGSEKSLSWNSESPNELWIGQRDGANENLIRDPTLLTGSAAGISSYPGGHNEGFPDTFKQLFKSFYTFVQGFENGNNQSMESAPFPTFADGHHEVLVCEAILKSHREQSWINVGE